MANLMRPALYGSYHHITVMGKENAPKDHVYDVTGSLCENNDKFAIDRMLQRGQAHSGEIFAEAYACMDDEPLLISVEVAEDTEVLMMDMHKILTICPSNCSHHHKLVENLLTILARKNLGLSRRMVYTASKSIRGRVLSYLSFLADKQGKKQVSIPFDRQEMADYLGVDRSALSAELSRMQKDGLIAYKKNHFTLFTDEL